MDFNGTFFASIISFLVFVFIMNKLLYEPIHSIVKKRNNIIDGNYECADKNNTRAEELEKDKNEKIVEAKENARVKYNEILAGFKEQKDDILKSAQEKSHTELEAAYADLSNVSNQAKESLKGKMTDLANDIVEKVLGFRSEVQDFDNEKVNDILYSEKG